jgi:3D-(3,5/4)-trihydroxycyclohexane-1,2-dione acylhydrolase (decyclizing)
VPSFNNLIKDSRHRKFLIVDFAKHAEAMGAKAEHVRSLGDLDAAIERAKRADTTSVIVIDTDAYSWTPGDAWWDVGVPEVSTSQKVLAARADHMAAKKKQRAGV